MDCPKCRNGNLNIVNTSQDEIRASEINPLEEVYRFDLECTNEDCLQEYFSYLRQSDLVETD